jgi:anionic cell wall polymer biosynthesis LytR-Cps2A-Psr (LCP) family protein
MLRALLVALVVGLGLGAPAGAVVAAPGVFQVGAESASCADPQSAVALARLDRTGRTILFDQFVQPFVDGATRTRATRTEQDPAYTHRIDQDLNAGRLNVALLGYGEEHDQLYDDVGVSVTILSLNLATWDMASISLSRDIRVPELEDESVHQPPRWPLTLRAAYRARGFDGIRAILEDATGLAIDFQVVMKDVFVRNYLNDVNGPVELVVPKDFQTNKYRLDGVEHDEDFIPAGRQTLSTDKVMTFVLAETLDPQGKADERSYRKDLLLKTLSCTVRQRLEARDSGFALNLLRFLASELNSQDLNSDFDFHLIGGGLGSLAQALITSGGNVDQNFPQVGMARELVVHDPDYGDGGVRRVRRIETNPDDQGLPDQPVVKQEIQLGSLAPYMLIPIGGNPYATDLVDDYWASVRSLVKSSLIPP